MDESNSIEVVDIASSNESDLETDDDTPDGLNDLNPIEVVDTESSNESDLETDDDTPDGLNDLNPIEVVDTGSSNESDLETDDDTPDGLNDINSIEVVDIVSSNESHMETEDDEAEDFHDSNSSAVQKVMIKEKSYMETEESNSQHANKLCIIYKVEDSSTGISTDPTELPLPSYMKREDGKSQNNNKSSNQCETQDSFAGIPTDSAELPLTSYMERGDDKSQDANKSSSTYEIEDSSAGISTDPTELPLTSYMEIGDDESQNANKSCCKYEIEDSSAGISTDPTELPLPSYMKREDGKSENNNTLVNKYEIQDSFAETPTDSAELPLTSYMETGNDESQDANKLPNTYEIEDLSAGISTDPTGLPLASYMKREDSESQNPNTLWNKYVIEDPSAEISTDSIELPLHLLTNSCGDDILRFYWWDAYEDPYKQPGVVFMFGKVFVPSSKTYHSCCLTIKNIPRRVFLLPRVYLKSSQPDEEPVVNRMHYVYNEFNQFANKYGIKEFRCNTVTKKYAFEQEGTPTESEYMQVLYAANLPAMPADYNGPAIERVFGTTINALELLLVERNIKGPCWLDIKAPLPTGMLTSWCPIKVNCVKMENISVSGKSQNLRIPPIVTGTINVRTCINAKNLKSEIVMVALLFHHNFKVDKEPPKPPFPQPFCLITKPRDTQWPSEAKDALSRITYAKVCDTEKDLLEEFLNIMNKTDPDLLIGYDCGYQFDLLAQRMFALKVLNWSRLGRLRKTTAPKLKGKMALRHLFVGRPICDIQISAKELNLKVRSYDLQSLCVAVLNKKEYECKEVQPEACAAYYNAIDKIENLMKLTSSEALFILTIAFDLNVIPLAVEITCIAGNVISRTLSVGCTERNEYLLLHAFHMKNYITPDKRLNKKGAEYASRYATGYSGGLVLEPKRGFYDKLILLMDFNSLYPSIIQEYNLCFTTVPGVAYSESENFSIPEGDLEPGVVPTEISKLVESRAEVKKLMKKPDLSPELKLQYNIRQLALKLTANSLYGCFGAQYCRFYAKGLAALITAKGREILERTKSFVEKLKYEVIYGDTDSLMINTKILEYNRALAIGIKIKKQVNKLYKKVELDVDGVFRYLLLLQKKKYAAVTMSKLPNGQIELAREYKGIEIVRKDWCRLACDVGKQILDILLSDQAVGNRIEKILNVLKLVSNNVRQNAVPLPSLVITKQLSKNPADYRNNKYAHVQVALRLNKKGGRMWKAGDTIPYIICKSQRKTSAAESAYHIDEYKKSQALRIDTDYYLLNQIFPIAVRLCEPIEGITEVSLAEIMGIKHMHKPKTLKGNRRREHLLLNEDGYKDCKPLKFQCASKTCGYEYIINAVVVETPSGGQRFSLAACGNSDCEVAPWTQYKSISNALSAAITDAINQYYQSRLKCDNPLCSITLGSTLPLDFAGKYPLCQKCTKSTMRKAFSDAILYNQLSFYDHLFDIHDSNYKSLLAEASNEMIHAYDSLKKIAEKHLSRSQYGIVDFDELFDSIATERIPPSYGDERLFFSDGSDDG